MLELPDFERLIPTEDDSHPLLTLKGKERRNYALYSFGFTFMMTVVLYVFPPYFGLEMLTTKVSYFFLNIFGFNPRLFIYEDQTSALGFVDRILYNLYDSSRATYPAISIEGEVGVPNYYIIVRACTGMQAGSLLLGLIWSTPAKIKDRINASFLVLLFLFIGNTLRIAAMIAITTVLSYDFGVSHEYAWTLAHDRMGEPLGFVGTILFTFMIEKRNVRILDPITLWIDTLRDEIYTPLKNRIFGSK